MSRGMELKEAINRSTNIEKRINIKFWKKSNDQLLQEKKLRIEAEEKAKSLEEKLNSLESEMGRMKKDSNHGENSFTLPACKQLESTDITEVMSQYSALEAENADLKKMLKNMATERAEDLQTITNMRK